jgi:hypothetical protein
MLYFAYGSNMQWRRISERCPSAKFACRALLPDYRLTFPRYSQNNGCWTASVEQADGQQVWGVVYDIDSRDIGSLNQQEGYRSGRANNKNAHIPLRCHVLDDGMKDKPLEVMTYITNVEGNPPPECHNVIQEIVEALEAMGYDLITADSTGIHDHAHPENSPDAANGTVRSP